MDLLALKCLRTLFGVRRVDQIRNDKSKRKKIVNKRAEGVLK